MKSHEDTVEEKWADEEGMCVKISLQDLEEEEGAVEKMYIEPFLKGKYSDINQKLINFYPKFVPTGKIYYMKGNFPRQIMGACLQRKICTKSQDLKYYWEEVIDINLPEDAEVWSKPNLDEEYYKKGPASPSSDSN